MRAYNLRDNLALLPIANRHSPEYDPVSELKRRLSTFETSKLESRAVFSIEQQETVSASVQSILAGIQAGIDAAIIDGSSPEAFIDSHGAASLVANGMYAVLSDVVFEGGVKVLDPEVEAQG